MSATRRDFLAAGLAAGLCPGLALARAASERSLKVAAVQMTPKLGDADANLEQAEQLIRQAQKQGAQWILLLPYLQQQPLSPPRARSVDPLRQTLLLFRYNRIPDLHPLFPILKYQDHDEYQKYYKKPLLSMQF